MKYVILGKDGDLYRFSFQEIVNNGGVYISDFFKSKNKFVSFIAKIHLSNKISKYINIPFKSFWLRKTFSKIPYDKDELCFIIFGDWIRIENSIYVTSILRKMFPGCKLVWFLLDLVKTIKPMYSTEPIDVFKFKSRFDLIVSYDRRDVEKYGLLYHPTVLSKIPLTGVENSPSYDVFFLAAYKGRLDKLIKICKILSGNGLKCGFFVYKVPKNRRVQVDGICYIDNPISYKDNIRMVSKSKCLLELIQTDSVGYTYRTSEALLYSKILITDNNAIKTAPFYDAQNIFLVDELDDKLLQLKDCILKGDEVVYNNAEIVKPMHFISFLNEQFLKSNR